MFSARTLAGTILALTLAQTALAAGATATAPGAMDQPPSASAPSQAGVTNAAAMDLASVMRALNQDNDLMKKVTAKLTKKSIFWEGVGFLGQFVFMMRFVVQWIASERKKKSVVPLAFWYLSVVGTLITLAYALSITSPSLIMASSLNFFIYIRNLHLIHGKPKAPEEAAAAA
jgi:lipid-A-disaccharide synthase-like uncharacterized protein